MIFAFLNTYTIRYSASGVIFITIGNGLVVQSSDPDRGYVHFT